MNLKIEEAFEDAVADFLEPLESSGLTIFKGFDDAQFLTPRIELEVSGLTFLETLDEFQQGSGLVQLEYGKFDLTMGVRVVTNADEGTTRTQHNSYVSQIRQLFLRHSDNFTEDNLPEHHVFYLRMESSTQMISGSARVTQTDYTIRASCDA